MPLYEVVLEQRFAEQQIINRWNYLGSGTPSSVSPSFALISALGAVDTAGVYPGGTLVDAIRDLQSSGVLFVQMSARAVFVDDDFYATPFLSGTVGTTTLTGESQSPFMAYGFRSTRVKQSIGRGYKRFVGVNEGATDPGGVLTSAANTAANAVRVAMAAVLSYDDEGNTLSFAPCIAQKLKYTTPSGKSAYKYYPTESAQSTHLAVGIAWETYPQVRSQTSRQYGRGS